MSIADLFVVFLWLSAMVACVLDFLNGQHCPKPTASKVVSSIIIAIIGPVMMPLLFFKWLLIEYDSLGAQKDGSSRQS